MTVILKNVVFSLALLFIAFQPTFAQYEYFAKENVQWRFMEKQGGFLGVPITNEVQNFSLVGDTVINSLTYKFAVGYSNKEILVRDDSMGKVYILENGIERILYDFTLVAGDSIFSVQYNGGEYIHVAATDSVFALNRYLKRIHFAEKEDKFQHNSSENIVWIEGMGNIHHPFALAMNNCEACGYWVTCYRSDDFDWEYSPGECSYLPVPELKKAEKIEINPSPFSQILNISVDHKPYEICVFDLYGNLVLRKIIQSDVSLNLEHLNNGLYLFYFYQNGNLKATRKVIKY